MEMYQQTSTLQGGYDAYSWSQEKKFGTKKWDAENKGAAGTDDTKYSLYALPTVQLNYQATPNVKLYAAAGAEYRDWAVANGNSATNWRWQPTVFAGFKTTFQFDLKNNKLFSTCQIGRYFFCSIFA